MFENRNLASHGDNPAPHTNCGVGINKLWHVTPPLGVIFGFEGAPRVNLTCSTLTLAVALDTRKVSS